LELQLNLPRFPTHALEETTMFRHYGLGRGGLALAVLLLTWLPGYGQIRGLNGYVTPNVQSEFRSLNGYLTPNVQFPYRGLYGYTTGSRTMPFRNLTGFVGDNPPRWYDYAVGAPDFNAEADPTDALQQLELAQLGVRLGGLIYPNSRAAGGTVSSQAAPSGSRPVTWSPTDGTALIEIKVPADAQIWFDGTRTAQTGAVRYYVTPRLGAGRTWTYEVRARWQQDGQPVTRTRQLQLEAGKEARLDLAAAAPR
jgi:uncharacterized protein (TIGR03000 family)